MSVHDTASRRIFSVFQGSVLAAGAGDGITRVGLPLLALTLTQSPMAIGLVTAAAWLPWPIVAIPAGVLSDRFPPLRVMRVTEVLRVVAILAVVFLALAGLLPIWMFAVGVFVIGATGVVCDIASQAAVPQLVEQPDLTWANGRVQSIQMGTVQLLGPAVAGFVVALGVAGALGVLSFTYVVSAMLLFAIPLTATRTVSGPAAPDDVAEKRSPLRETADGFVYFVRRPDVLKLAAHAAAINFTFIGLMTVLPLWVVDPGPLGMTTGAYGILWTVIAAGGLIAGLVAHRFFEIVPERLFVRLCLPAFAVSVLLLTIPHVVPVAVGLTAFGVLLMFWNVVTITYRQRTVPTELFSRVNAAYRWLSWSVMPVGAALSGTVAGLAGVQGLLVSYTVLLVFMALVLPPRLRTSEPAEPVERVEEPVSP